MKNSGSGPKNACSAMPLDLRYASARRATPRGSREYACMVAGSRMSQVSTSVGSAVNGSRKAVDASGNSTMSDWWMPFQPEMLEPSNILPSSNRLASMIDLGNVTWCCTPRMSAKRRSTNSTLCSLMSFSIVSRDMGGAPEGCSVVRGRRDAWSDAMSVPRPARQQPIDYKGHAIQAPPAVLDAGASLATAAPDWGKWASAMLPLDSHPRSRTRACHDRPPRRARARHHRRRHRIPPDLQYRPPAGRRTLARTSQRPVQHCHPGRRDPGGGADLLAPALGPGAGLLRPSNAGRPRPGGYRAGAGAGTRIRIQAGRRVRGYRGARDRRQETRIRTAGNGHAGGVGAGAG